MKSKATAGLYVLLIIFAAISMVYYVAGVVALREEFFHASRYSDKPFDFHDDGQTLDGVRKEARAAGLSPGDFVIALNGVPFTGFAQVHDLVRQSKPGTLIRGTRAPPGKVRDLQIRLAPRQGPNFLAGT